MCSFIICLNTQYRLCSVHTYDVHAQSTVVHVHSVFIVASIEKKRARLSTKSAVSVNFLLRKYYNYLNNIDMALLRTSYMYESNTILDYNLVRFGVCMIKFRHERMLILRCILPPKN